MAQKTKPKKRAPKAAFWLVWRASTDWRLTVPRYQHATEEEARKEAERLARNTPGERFYVLPAQDFAIAEISPVKWDKATEAIAAETEIPF